MSEFAKSPKWVSQFWDRHGNLRLRFRRRGCSYYFKSMFDTEAFWIEYKDCLERSAKGIDIGASQTAKGSFSDLAVQYYQSAGFISMADSTKATYRNIIERFRLSGGKLPVARITKDDVERWIANRATTPAAANNLLRMFRILMRFAIAKKLRHDDPSAGVAGIKIKSSGFHSWTDDEIAAYERRWRVGTKERLAFDLLLYTAQRGSDVRLMGPQHMRHGRVTVRQKKTGAYLEIPVHAKLKTSLARCKSGHMTFLATKQGAPYSVKGFQNFVADAARKAGLADCAAHGLRKAAARRLAEAGCSASQIAAITGHKTLREVERYTRAAEQVRLADDAMAALSRNEQGPKVSNRGRLAKKAKASD